MTVTQLKQRLETLAPGTLAHVTDLTGTEDHYQAVIVSPAFAGKGLMDQHRMVYALVETEMRSNELHAFTMKTYLPEKYPGDYRAELTQQK